MYNQQAFEQSLANAMALNKQASLVKQAFTPLDPIAEIPVPGGRFSSHKLEQDYQMKHPVISMFHPGIYGGAGIGALASRFMKKKPMMGVAIGAAAGVMGEAIHRYQFLSSAKTKMDLGQNPINPSYDF